jgi:glycosyltransferase involved in cell wall biosynthesis
MNVLFLTLSSLTSIDERGIYSDLLRKIVYEGHSVYIVTPLERRFKQSTELLKYENYQILRVKTLNVKKTNVFEKGIGILLLENQFKSAINKYWNDIKFDLILYSTPPITFNHVIEFIKKRDNAKTYLLLKDIFPQNAVDLGLIWKGGLLYRFFRQKEVALYAISDRIGCMSPANRDYICKHNPNIDQRKVHINPNSIEVRTINELSLIDKIRIRNKYKIPVNATVFIYGGNIGKPQGINFLLKVLEKNIFYKNVFFIIVGSGTEINKVSKWFKENQPPNALLLPFLPKPEFDELLSISDVGLVFLDPRFTIPNFPSRLLSYLEFSLPILAATDLNTDIGKIAQENGFGFWCENGDLTSFCNYIDFFVKNEEFRFSMGKTGNLFLKMNYSVDLSYSTIFEEYDT